MSSRRRRRAAKKTEESGTSAGTAPDDAGGGDWSTASFVAGASSTDTRGEEAAAPGVSLDSDATADSTKDSQAVSKKTKQRGRKKKKKPAGKARQERGNNSVDESDYLSDGASGADSGGFFELPTTALALTYKALQSMLC